MKPGEILAIMTGIVDGCYGAGTVDDIIEAAIEGKDNNELMIDLVKKMRDKEDAKK